MMSRLLFLLPDSLTAVPVANVRSVDQEFTHYVSKKHEAGFCDLTFSPVIYIDLLQTHK